MVHITTAAMWQKLNISKQSQRIVLRYLSNIFGTKLVVPKYCIDGFRQDHVIPQYDFFIYDRKNVHFMDKTYFQNIYYIT